VLTPDGPPAEAAAEHVEHGPVEAVEPGFVDLVELQRAAGDVAGDDAVGTDLGVVADPAQQPIGDPRGAPGAGGDLGRSGRLEGYVEQPGRTVHDQVELVGLVELEVAR
jgi:hypothetical protein